MPVDSTGDTRILSCPDPRETTCQTSPIRGKLIVNQILDLRFAVVRRESSVELSDRQTIANLILAPDRGQRLVPANPAGPGPSRQHRAARISHCECGSCPNCQENARWERIFQEKFADPDYYRPRPIRRASPLL